MSITGKEEHDISLLTASTMTKNYRDTITTGTTIAHYFNRAIIDAILDQQDCTGIRMYYALDNDGRKQLVLTGVDSSGNDLYNGVLGDRSVCCPFNCSTANPLNTTHVA